MLTTPEIVEALCDAERLMARQKRGPARKRILALIVDLTGKPPVLAKEARIQVDWDWVFSDPANLLPASVLADRFGITIPSVLGAAKRRNLVLPPAPAGPRAAKGIDWAAVLSDPRNLRLCNSALARKLGVALTTSRAACKKYKVTLPKGQGGHPRKVVAKPPRQPKPAVRVAPVQMAPPQPRPAGRSFTKPLAACENQFVARRLRYEATDLELAAIARNNPRLLHEAGIAWR